MATPALDVATSPTEVTVAATGFVAPVGVTSAVWPFFSLATSVSSTVAFTTNDPVLMTTTSAPAADDVPAELPVEVPPPEPGPPAPPDPPTPDEPDAEDEPEDDPPADTC